MSNLQTFNESTLSTEGRILVKFGAPWCGPCQSVAPVLESMANDDVNTDEDPDSAVKYGIRSVPTFIVFENGVEVTRETGAMQKSQLIGLLGE
jgi:thioredoxin 1